jgi:hypothetical protein
MDLGEQAHRVKFMIRDRGPDYTAAFDAVLADAGIRTVLCNVRTPRMNAIAAVLAMHREHDGRVLSTDSEPRRTGFRTPFWPRAGFGQIGAIEASREPSRRPYSEAMMIRPVSRDGIRGPGFRCHSSPMCSSRVIISCPHGRRARLRPKARPSATVP